MALTKPPVLPPWAEAGDKVQPTNAEIQTGWPLSNTPPARQRWNWILNFLANGVRYLTRRGLPDYSADETYMIGDRVIGDDGKTYRSLQDDNINHAPSASPLWWEEWAPSLSRLADLLQKQTYTAFTTAGAAPNFTLTPAPAITAYTAGQRFRIKFHAAGSGADTLNVSGRGNKNLKQYDGTGAKIAANVKANQLVDVEYDGVDMVLLNQLPTAVVDASDTVKGIVELATNAEVQAGTDTVRAVTPAGLASRTATDTMTGVVELATNAEVQAGTDTVRAITPAGFRAGLNAAGNAPVFACRGWGNINTVGTMTVKSGGNVLGVTDHGTGDFTVTMTTALPHENYAVVFGSSGYADNGQTLYVPALKPAAGSGAQPPVLKTTTAFRVMIGQGYGAAYHDVPDVSFAVFC